MSILKECSLDALIVFVISLRLEKSRALRFHTIRLKKFLNNDRVVRRRELEDFRWRGVWHYASLLLSIELLVAIAIGVAYLPVILTTAIGRSRPPIAVAMMALGLGTLAYWFKKLWLLAYGITEVVFGTASAYQIAGSLHLADVVAVKWAALVASIYVISRGLSNISDAIQKRYPLPEISVWRKLQHNNILFEKQKKQAREGIPEIFITEPLPDHTFGEALVLRFRDARFRLRQRIIKLWSPSPTEPSEYKVDTGTFPAEPVVPFRRGNK